MQVVNKTVAKAVQFSLKPYQMLFSMQQLAEGILQLCSPGWPDAQVLQLGSEAPQSRLEELKKF